MVMFMGVIGARLGLEGSLHMLDPRTEVAHHVLEHVVAKDAQEGFADLYRYVPVTEVIGDAREVRRLDVCKLLRRRGDLDYAAVRSAQAIASAQHEAARQHEPDLLAGIQRRALAAALPVLEGQAEAPGGLHVARLELLPDDHHQKRK